MDMDFQHGENLLDELVGDVLGTDFEAASFATKALSELAQGGISLAKDQAQKKDDKQKQALVNDWRAEHTKADAAQKEADAEASPLGSKHAAARAAWAREAVAKQLLLARYPDALTDLTLSKVSDTLLEHKDSGGGGNFLTKVWHGVPVWGWGVGGLGVATGLVFLLRALFRHGRK